MPKPIHSVTARGFELKVGCLVIARASGSLILKTAVELFKIPFALSPSKGERDFESHPMGERRNAAHASTSLSSNSSRQRLIHGNALPRARGLFRSARTAFLRSNGRF
ncbi:MAG: hypothetical protein ACKN9W_03065 [Methylococcus sp.]